ncbi:MAG: division/cell wall cluster transcriptional repressor MraZ [Hyphomicrobiaceae bacterium]|nr:division/cell wall cluster transcriptional repressor MraZ [Hyphomicrobiaceae bacterium]
MDRFLGRYAKRVDAKGRVSVPAPFRAVAGRSGFEGLYCVQSLWHPAIEAGGQALIDSIDAVVGGFDPLSLDHDQVATALLGAGEILALDAEGRVGLPGWIKDATGIVDEVIFVGQGGKFQLWSPERFAGFEADARARTAALLQARGRTASGGTP